MKKMIVVLLAAGMLRADSTWTGGGVDANWSTGANWAEAQAPSGGILAFAGSAKLANTNDLSGLSISGLRFASGAGQFLLDGNPLSIGGFIENNSTSQQTVGNPLALTGDLLLTVPNTGNLLITNTISGTGNIYRSGNGAVGLYAANTFVGNIYNSNSWFVVRDSRSFGDTNNVFYQLGHNTSLLAIENNVTISNRLVMYGSTGNGAFISRGTATTNTLAGTLFTTNQIRIQSINGGTLHIKGGVESIGTGGELFVLNAYDNGLITFSEKPVRIPYRKFYADAGNITLAVAGNQWASLMKAGSTLRLDVPNCLPSDKPVQIGVGYSQSGTIDLNGNNQIFGGLCGINDPTKGMTLVKSDAPAVLTVNQVAAGDYTGYDGNFAGPLEIIKVGSRDLIVTGTNCTHTGPVTIGQGPLSVRSVAPIGLGIGSFNAQQLVISNNATFRLGAYTTVASNQVLPATHGVWIPSGTGKVEVASDRELKLEAPVGGDGILMKTGGGTLVLNGGFAGSKIVASVGNLRLPGTTEVPVEIASGASFGYQPSVSPLDAGALVPAGSSVASDSLIALDASQAPGQFLQVDGVFSDVGGTAVGLNKVNPGTVLLTGASTYTGITRFSDGTVRILDFPLNDEASPIGIASTNSSAKLYFAGGTFEYAGLADAVTYRLFTRASGQAARFCVTNAGTTLWIANYQRSNGMLIKTGEGTLRLTRDSAQSAGSNISGGPNYILGGVLETAADDATTGRFKIQQNIGTPESSGPAVRFGDGGTLRYDMPLQIQTHGARQLVDYVGTSRRGTMENGWTICGPTNEPGNTITFAINDGTDDIDFVTKSTLNPYPGATGYSCILKTGDGTWKIAGSGCRGTFTIRAGRMLVAGDITASGSGSPLGINTNQYGIVLGDDQTGSTNRPSVIYDGAAASFNYVRGTYVHTNAFAQIGSVSNIAVTINADIGLDGILGFYSATLGNTFAVNCALNGIGGIAKTGPGVVNLNAANGYTGRTIVEAGTLRVNADGAIPNGRDLVMNGGTLNLNGRTVSFGTLTLGGTATIDAAQGLVFADSPAKTWTGRVTFANRGNKKIYFGTTQSGLTAGQLACIALPPGYREVKLLADGQLFFVPNGTVMILK